MNVTYSDKARQWGEGYTLLQHATKRLEEVLGPSADGVKAEWDRREDAKGRAHCTLRLSDWTGAVNADFSPDELKADSHMHVRLHQVWGELLQARSHRQLQELIGSGE